MTGPTDGIGCLSRREFIRLTAIGVAGVAMAGCGGNDGDEGDVDLEELLKTISNRPTRRDIATMSMNDPTLQTFKDAVVAMKQLRSSDLRNWDQQALIHRNHCPHANWLTLPWHRAYLYYFEEICRELTGDERFALPYWNWQKDRRVPSAFWGGEANPLFHSRREVGETGELPSSVVGPNAIQRILDQENFLLFASGSIGASEDQRTASIKAEFEWGPHDTVHMHVGGDMGNPQVSPRDPVFWCHHGMIEALWVEWNVRWGYPNSSNPNWVNRRFTEFVDRKGNSVDIAIHDLLLHPLLLYRYDDPVLGTS